MGIGTSWMAAASPPAQWSFDGLSSSGSSMFSSIPSITTPCGAAACSSKNEWRSHWDIGRCTPEGGDQNHWRNGLVHEENMHMVCKTWEKVFVLDSDLDEPSSNLC